jgi:hypothetical protein
MRLDPRRNVAATMAGIVGIGLFAVGWAMDPTAPFGPGRYVLLAAAFAGLVAGAWPSRRVRFVVLVPVVLALTFLGIVVVEGIGLAIVVVAVIAAYGLFIESRRESWPAAPRLGRWPAPRS